MTPIYVVCQIELREGLEENKILTFSKLALTTREEHNSTIQEQLLERHFTFCRNLPKRDLVNNLHTPLNTNEYTNFQNSLKILKI